MGKRCSSFVISLIIFSVSCGYAETIKLKNGKIVEGRIIEKTDSAVKMNIVGIPITYYFNEIESIDGTIISTPKETSSNISSISKDPADIFQNISPAIGSIFGKIGSHEKFLGTGFIVDASGIVVTNFHVLQDANEISIHLEKDIVYPAVSLIYYDVNRDVCIFKIETTGLATIAMGDSGALRVGEKIYCVGNPSGLERSFSDGILSGVRNYNGLQWLQFSAPVSAGNSGGPIINAQGEVVGIVTYGLDSVTGQNLNFALAINEIKPYVAKAPKIGFREFIEDPVRKADYYCMRANKYLLEGSYDLAVEYYQKTIQVNSGNAVVYYNLGVAYYSSGKSDAAIPCFEKAIQLDPSSANAYANLGVMYNEAERFREALDFTQKALEKNPQLTGLYLNLGNAHRGLGRYQEAITDYQKYVAAFPDNASGAYFGLGCSYKALEKKEEALNFFKKAVELDPAYAAAYWFIGDIYQSRNQHQEAIPYLKKSIEISEKDPRFLNSELGILSLMTLGTAYSHAKQYDEARECLLKAKQLAQARGEGTRFPVIDEELRKIP